MNTVEHFYRYVNGQFEHCFNIEASAPLSPEELKTLKWLLAETFAPEDLSRQPLKKVPNKKLFEFGPRLNFATAFNTNALAICQACGLTKITRLEKSRRLVVEENIEPKNLFDRMTEEIYSSPLETFDTGKKPELVYAIPLTAKGPGALLQIPGLSMDEADRNFYYHYFVEIEHRDPTIVEILDLNNANSEHSRHGYFRGKQFIDGVEMPKTLMEIVKSTLVAHKNNSILAFKDNSSGIRGYDCWILVPDNPEKASVLNKQKLTYHFIFSAETHNFPTGVAPRPGAETGTGGRIRDIQATGRGGIVVAGTTGYFVGNLFIPKYNLPWEKQHAHSNSLATGLAILIEGSNGASDYGNKFGEPVIVGTAASVAIDLPNGEHQAYDKPILFTGGLGLLDARHVEKNEAEPGMLIVQVGGPAYRIGFGGGAASSLNQGDNAQELDFNAVQRGDGEMGRKVNNVVRACISLGENNPIVIIHDQGAGGPANVLKELVEKYGGKIDIRKIQVGDPTLSVLEIWVCEYQERNGFVIKKDDLTIFQKICNREKVNCEVLGEVTDDGYFVVYDSQDGSTPVNLDLKQVLGNIPQKTFHDFRQKRQLEPLSLPPELTIQEALNSVLKLLSVGSKDFLTRKVDRSVTGKIAQQQCVGPLGLTVADVGIISQGFFPNSNFEFTGAATSIGEKHMEMMINPKAAARMTVAEMLTNMASALITNLSDIKCSGNWMWAPKFPGEGARLYDAALSLRDFMVELGIAIDGGKDSLSMATKIKLPNGSTEIVKSPSQLIISGYAPMDDITKKVTPDIKYPGQSCLLHIDLARGQRRLGGSALAQVFSQLGDEVPDIESKLLANGFMAVQKLIAQGMICSIHDISKGGFITTLLEMAFSGNCGLDLSWNFLREQALAELFHEEAGWVIEYLPSKENQILSLLRAHFMPYKFLGKTTLSKKIAISNTAHDFIHLNEMKPLRLLWEETSYQLQKLQSDSSVADIDRYNKSDRGGPMHKVSFALHPVPVTLSSLKRPPVAIIREEGSNGHEEMAAAFRWAGFDPWDVQMTDLLNGQIDLKDFQVIAFVGGFSYADVLDSAKGWAASIRFNKPLKKMFDDFYNRPDTLSLGICNGCQLSTLLGWVPLKKIEPIHQARFIRNKSGIFESHFLNVSIGESPASQTWLEGMEGSILGIWSAHGEGQVFLPDNVLQDVLEKRLAPIRYVDDGGQASSKQPFNPNGSILGIAGFCSEDGRHLAMMPHPERSFLKWQLAYLPEELQSNSSTPIAPWLRLFINARKWIDSEFANLYNS